MPASSSPICSRAPASRALRRENVNYINLLVDIRLRRTGLRFFAMVTGHETIETIHDINWKNFTATPSSSNAGHESRREADFRRKRDQRPLIPKFLPPTTRTGCPPPGRAAFGGSQSGSPSCSYCRLPLLTSKASRTRDAADVTPRLAASKDLASSDVAARRG
jgi:hypothetical protein